jgi:hypothetical protein
MQELLNPYKRRLWMLLKIILNTKQHSNNYKCRSLRLQPANNIPRNTKPI